MDVYQGSGLMLDIELSEEELNRLICGETVVCFNHAGFTGEGVAIRMYLNKGLKDNHDED